MNAVKTGNVPGMPDQPDQPQDVPLLTQRTSGPRPPAPPETDSLSLDDAVRIYGVSMSTLRRRLRRGELPGAYKVAGPKGDEWRIPAGALEQAGYQPVNAAANGTPPTPAAAAREGRDDGLAHTLEALHGVLERFDVTQRQLMAAEEDRGRAEREREEWRIKATEWRGRIHVLEPELERAHARAEELQAELDRARRPWWRRIR